jgi:hypothetical protein
MRGVGRQRTRSRFHAAFRRAIRRWPLALQVVGPAKKKSMPLPLPPLFTPENLSQLERKKIPANLYPLKTLRRMRQGFFPFLSISASRDTISTKKKKKSG